MKKIAKFFCMSFASLLCAGAFAFGTRDTLPDSQVSLRVAVLNGPTAIPAAYMMEHTDTSAKIQNTGLSFETFADPQAVIAKLVKGEIDIAFLPPNLASKAYSSANALKVVGTSGYGNLYLVTKDKAVASLSDLKGKTVHVAGQGSTPDYMFRYLLSENGISADKNGVTLDFSVQAPNLAAALISGKIAYAVLPEPFATVASARSQEVRRALDLQKEYAAVSGNENFPLTVMVVRRHFAEANKGKVKSFAAKFAEAVRWTNANPQEAGALAAKHTLGLEAQIVALSIPHANFTWQDAKKSKKQIETLLAIFGEKLPDEGFYFN